MTVRIIIADDHKIIRDGLRSLLSDYPEMEVVAEANDGLEAVRLAREIIPDVMVIDVAMPKLNGIEAARNILSKVAGIKVIALSMHSDGRFVTEMLKSGVSGYLLKDCAFEELHSAIKSVVAGKLYLSPDIAGVVVEDYLKNLPENYPSAFSALTAREREVLQLLAEGNSTSQIASTLHLSVKTVDNHRSNIMNKLGIHTIAGLTKYAIREGLTSV